MPEQMNLFSFSTPRFHIGKKKIRLIELFAGIGAQAKYISNVAILSWFKFWKGYSRNYYEIRKHLLFP